MKRFIPLAFVGVLTAVLASPSFAADLPTPAYKAPAYTPVPYFSWTGFYAGVNAGYIWSSDFGDNGNGFAGGGQIGYNWQLGSFVIGAEADFQGTTLDASETTGGLTATAKLKTFGTVRGRLGYAFNRFLVYGTGGYAYSQTELSLTNGTATVSDSAWSSGYAVGGGLEWALWDRWSARAEYLYVDSGDTTLTLGGVTATGSYKFNVARAALNYRF